MVGNYLLGPLFGGLLFAVATGLPFGFDSLTFLASAILLFSLPRTADRRSGQHLPSWGSVTVGLRWLIRQRLLRVLAFLIGLNNFCNLLAQATLVLLAVQHFGMRVGSYGLLLGAMAIGGVAGGMLNTRVSRRFGWLPSMLFALAVNAAAYLAVGLAPNAVVLAVLMALSGFAMTLWNVASLSIRQTLIPQDMFGRVNSVFRMLSWGLMPLGALVGGFVAHQLGVVAPFPVAGTLRAAGLLVALPVLLRAHREMAVPATRAPVG
jgi:MFS family permease